MKVLVTGAAGHLGSAVVEHFSRDHEVLAFVRADLDITDAAAVAAAVSSVRPDVIINCAAYNDVDGAEDHPLAALELNSLAVLALARAARDAGGILVHYSTDFVFDGEGTRPYTEEDRPNPRCVYAASKLLGEWLARDAPRNYVVRVESLFGGTGPHSRKSVGKIVDLIARGEEVPVFVDRVASPTHVGEAAAATATLIRVGAAYGTYHCVNSGSCRWDELATEVARLLGRQPKLKPITLDDLPLKAKRPRYCVLSNTKLKEAGAEMSHWRDALRSYVAALTG